MKSRNEFQPTPRPNHQEPEHNNFLLKVNAKTEQEKEKKNDLLFEKYQEIIEVTIKRRIRR
jgi:hypothetical protein